MTACKIAFKAEIDPGVTDTEVVLLLYLEQQILL